MNGCRIGVAFLAYSRHPDWRHAFRRFAESYERHPAGIAHRLYIIFKGFDNGGHLREAEELFSRLEYTPIYLEDRGFGIWAYKMAARKMCEEMIGFLNTKSEILCSDWLRKLALQLGRAEVGLVGNSGSFETLARMGSIAFPDFPNVHIRTNAFLIRAELFRVIVRGRSLRTRLDGWKFESGWNSLSREILRKNLMILVVGRDGRGYTPREWPASGTYRSPSNTNVLVGDDDYRHFPALDPAMRTARVRSTWGDYVHSPPSSENALFVRSPLSGTLGQRTAAYMRDLFRQSIRWLRRAGRRFLRRALPH